MSKTFAQKSVFPLDWPHDIEREKNPVRNNRFKATLYEALKNVQDSLRRFADDSDIEVTNIVISSNVTLGSLSPDDPGVCVYFDWDGDTCCYPIDLYDKIEHNLHAIHMCIEARRTELRHGGVKFVKSVMKRGQTLSLEDGSRIDWKAVLGITDQATLEELKARRRELVKIHHPDQGGNAETWNRICKAYEAASKTIKEKQ